MRTVVIAVATIALLTAPAYSRGRGAKHSGSEQQSAEQKKKAAESEKAYNAALSTIPDKKYDPWANMR